MSYLKPLVLWTDGQYRVYRSKSGMLSVDISQDGYWKSLRRYSSYQGYCYHDRRGKLKLNRIHTNRGCQWATRYQRLVGKKAWVVKCTSVDGEGTLCPNYQQDGCGCHVTEWCLGGYIGSFPARRAAPDQCDAPLDSLHWTLPGKRDKHGFSLGDYRDILLRQGK